MSLFKVREFWSIECDVDEKFDSNCVEVAKLNDDTDKIILGSHSGILRIYQPSTETDHDNVINGFKPSDLLIEKIFPEPILQLCTGRLVSGSQNVHIAVLYPRSIGVFSLVRKDGVTEHGIQNMLKLMYEHKLKRSAASVVIGPFGGSQNRDFICVQSLDGLLSIFEQESFAFCCFLPNFLLPGPLVYMSTTDSFVTVNSTFCVESYRYKSLSEAGQNSSEENSSGFKIENSWNFNLGEGVLDLRYLKDSNNYSYLSILGERNLYCLNENGKMKFMKRLDFTPICFFTYTTEEENTVTTLLLSETCTLLIYQNATVKWSAQLSFLPIAIKRAFFKSVKGAIILLTKDGKLGCHYLGTEPQLFVTPPHVNKELDFEKAEDELLSLTQIIRNYYSSDTKMTNNDNERELQVVVALDPSPDWKMCILSVTLIPEASLEEVQVSVKVEKPFKCNEEIQYFDELNEKITLSCQIYIEDKLEVSSLDVDTVASYISNLGVPRVVVKKVILPLKMVMVTCPALKDSANKITLNINQDPVPLATIFSEFCDENLLSTTNVMGFEFSHTTSRPVTILLAKNSQRYRLQSESITALSILLEQMIIRLKKHFDGETKFSVSFNSALPTVQLLECIGQHFQKRKAFDDLEKELNQLGGQFRVIQKRLISKFKDKHPTSLLNLDKVLQSTYSAINKVTLGINSELSNLAVAQIKLAAILRITVNLLKIMDVNKDLLPILETTFLPTIHDLDSQNWEDTFDTSLSYLLRTVLCKSDKDKIQDSNFEQVVDIKKVEKRVLQVLDRFTKGTVTVDVKPSDESAKTEDQTLTTQRELMPIGSRFGESSMRALSAKNGSRRHPNLKVT